MIKTAQKNQTENIVESASQVDLGALEISKRISRTKSKSTAAFTSAPIITAKNKKEIPENLEIFGVNESIEQEISQQFQESEKKLIGSDRSSKSDIFIAQSSSANDWVKFNAKEVNDEHQPSVNIHGESNSWIKYPLSKPEVIVIEKESITPFEPSQMTHSESRGLFESPASAYNFKFLGAAAGLSLALGIGSSSGGGSTGTAPNYQSTTVNGVGGVAGSANLVINFDRLIDSAHLPPIWAFKVTVNGVPNDVSAIGASGNSITLTLQDALPSGYQSIGISYVDPTAGDDANAIQDSTGVDASNFSIISGVVIDGYISGAKVYVDTNSDGIGTSSDYYVGVTDSTGRFFLSNNIPKGNIVVSGGVNTDTGLSNTLILKTPVPTDLSKAFVINPLTTLVTSMVDDSSLNLTLSQAKSKVVAALNITLPTGVDVFSYDPIFYGDANSQKISAQIASVVSLATNGQSAQQAQVNTQKIFENIATQITSATSGSNATVVQLQSVIGSLLLGTSVVSDATSIAISLASIDSATTLAGITSAQSQIFNNVIQQDTTAPSAPVFTTSTGTINSATPTIAGTAEANSTVSIYDGSTLLGAVTANSSGVFSYASTSALSQAAHAITAKATDVAGNISAASTVITLTVDTTAPSAPVITTSTATINSTTPTISGTAEASSTVSIYDGSTLLGTAVANGSGAFSYTPTSALSQAAHAITAKATDVAGNISAASTVITLTVDTTAPNAPVISTSTATVNSTTPTVAGTAEADSTVSIYDGSTLLGTTTANGSGAFSYTSSALSQSAHSITAKATDAAGNASAASTAITLTVAVSASTDQIAPTLAAPPPLAGATNVNVNTNIVLTFSEAVQAGTGNIIISDGSGDVRTISVTDATQVSFSGNVVTINPIDSLWLSTQSSTGSGTTNTILNRTYSVQMAAGVFKDTSNNAFAGIANATTLSFTIASSNVTTIQIAGDSSNRIDMVVIGDGYRASEIAAGKLSTDVQSLVSYFFKKGDISQPFGRYVLYFNISAIEVASVDSGIDLHIGGSVNVNTALDGQQLSLDRLLSVSSSKAEAVAASALTGTGVTADLRVASVNSNVYGGAGGAWATYSGGGMEVALHEVGHSYAALADEYIDPNVVSGASSYSGSTDFGKANVTINSQALTWAPWLGKYQPGIGVIGAYQGANYYANGVYRPSVDSKMRDIGNNFDFVTREKFVLSFYQNVHPLDFYSGSDTRNVSISALPIDPTLIDLTWTVDGVVQSFNGSVFDLSTLSIGSHTVNLTAQDNTGWIRPGYMNQATQTQTWTLNSQSAVDLPAGNNTYTANSNGWIKGSSGNDTITGTAANDRLEGGAGNDALNGGDGDDVLIGGDGTNVLDGGTGVNTVSYEGVATPVTVSLSISGSQQTTLTSSDTLLNIQNLIGGSGADSLTGDDSANYLQGLAGNDALKGGVGNNILDGGDGNDTLEAGNGNNRIYGGAGDDSITVGNGNNLIYGDDGNDTIIAGNGDNRIFGGAGNDQITVAGGSNSINVGIGNDIVNGGAGNDVIQGGAGTNTLNGGGGVNTLSYEEATVNLSVSLAVSVAQTTGYSIDAISNFQNLIGGSGNDTLTGNASANTLQGGLGNDLLVGGAGDDIYVGGGGSDTVSFVGATQGVVATLLPVNPTIDYTTDKAIGLATGEGTDTLWQISNLIGSQYGDQLTGDGFANTLNGGGGRDVLTGGGGADTFILSSPIGQSTTSTISYMGSGLVDPSIPSKFYIPFDGSLIGGSFSFVITDPWGYGVGPYQGGYLNKATISGSSTDGTLASLVASFKLDSDYSLMDYTIDLGDANHSNAIAVTFKSVGSVSMNVNLTSSGISFPTITDFLSGTDCIDLSSSIFSSLGTVGSLDTTKLCMGSAAQSSADRIIYNAASGVISYDADGTGASAAMVIAVLSNKPQTLSASDFVVI